jgi:glycosyltransferase involved in cell wall biosynthesis
MISVIVPVYNGEGFIKDTINSILNQTIEDIEIIIVNDGSTDATEEILQSIHDKRIKYYKQENKGAAAAKNLGLRHCEGNFITFHDSDDISLPNRFEKLLEGFHGNVGFVHSDMLLINETNQPIGYWQSSNIQPDDIFSFFLNVGTPFNNGTILYRREVLANQHFNAYKIGEDTEFVIKIAMKHPSYHIHAPLYLYRRHSSNSTKSFSYQQLAEHIKGIIQNTDYHELLNDITSGNNKEKCQLTAQLIMGEAIARRGMIQEGFKLFETAIPLIKDKLDRDFYEGMKALVEKRYEDVIKIFGGFQTKNHIIENYLGEAYLSIQNYNIAYEHFFNALINKPNYGTPLQNLKALGQLNSHHFVCQYKHKFKN